MTKKLVKAAAICCAAALALTACAKTDGGGSSSAETKEINVAAIETAYGQEGWKAVAAAFEEETGIKVNLTMDKNLEDVIGPQMKAGDYPDVIHLALNREAGLTETMVKDKALTEITDVLDMTIPGEDGTVKDKLTPGIETSNATMPYGDGKLYLAPMFYSPTGFYYDANLLKTKGWDVPTTWDEMWALGDKAKAEGIYLFAYPTAGYFDAIFYALCYEAGGQEFFDKVSTYGEGVWDSAEGKKVYEILYKISQYTDPVVPAQANSTDFTKNQQLVLDNKAIFMPNGTWVVGEMADAPRVDGFEWASMALPAIEAGGDRYSYTFIEEAWIPAKAKNVDAAKQFVAFLYSDAAVEAFSSAPSPAFQPVNNVLDYMDDTNKMFYSVYDQGAKAGVGNMSSTDSTVEWKKEYLFPMDSAVSGSLSEADWIAKAKAANDTLREALVK